MGGSGHGGDRGGQAAGAGPARQVAVDVECEGVERAAQETHGRIQCGLRNPCHPLQIIRRFAVEPLRSKHSGDFRGAARA